MATLGVRELRKMVSGWESLFGRMMLAAEEISQALERIAPGFELPVEPVDRGTRWCEHEYKLRKVARAGVRDLELTRLPDGSALVTLYGRVLRLPRALANILEVLLLDEGTVTDSFVPPKSYAVVREFLWVREGTRPSDGTIRQRISELTKALRAHLVNPYLVENTKNEGWRFLKWRKH